MEIERKYLVDREKWNEIRKDHVSRSFLQVYLSLNPAATVRIRLSGEEAFLTIKGASEGLSRAEFEYRIPYEEAAAMVNLKVGSEIRKHRYDILHDGFLWEVDEFLGDNEGLILAEVELSSEEQEPVRPDWVFAEVSGDERYYNAYLALHPYKSWSR